MKSQMSAVALLVVLFLLIMPTIFSAVPVLLNHSGRLLDASDNPVNETVSFTFKLYKTQFTPAVEWQEDKFGTMVNKGIWHVTLGDLTPFPEGIFENEELWLGIKVNSDPELSPRMRMLSVPYSVVSAGVSGDIETNPGELHVIGYQSSPPQIIVRSDPVVTPTVDEYLRLNDLSVALVIDRGAGNRDWSVLQADKLTVWHPTGEIAAKLDQRPSLTLSAADVPVPPLPGGDSPYLAIADDVFNQLFASLTQAGSMKTECVTLGTAAELTPSELTFTSSGGVTLGTRVGYSGLTVDGGDINLIDGNIRIDGLSTRYTMFTNDNIRVHDGSTTHVDIGSGGGGAGGGYLDLSGGSGGGRVRISALGTGDLRADGSSVTLEPSSGGAGGRVALESTELVLTDDVPTATARLHRSDGLTLDLATGSSAYYRADGVQLTGPDASRFGASSRAFSLTRPSGNGALLCTLDDPSGLFHCDLDDDGLVDVAMVSLPSKRLNLGPGVELRCNGFASIGSCEITGTLDVISSSTYQGTMTCRSGWYCDANNDATVDVSCQAAPTPEFSIAPGTSFACDGLATFAQPTAVNSDLTVTGALLVTGPKMFVQQHPGDETKEILYVALEGNEAGTYTRGTSQLKDGVAKIELPEDFHLVTNEEGLTAQITPRGPVSSMLFVESVTATLLVVKSSDKKESDVKFDFMVNGLRKGYENHQVIRNKKSLAMND